MQCDVMLWNKMAMRYNSMQQSVIQYLEIQYDEIQTGTKLHSDDVEYKEIRCNERPVQWMQL